jgi:hypothetical protein
MHQVGVEQTTSVLAATSEEKENNDINNSITSSSSSSSCPNLKNSVGNDIGAILLSSSDQCKDIANIYKQYLKKSNDEDDASIIKALPIPLAPSTFTPAIKLLSQTYSCTPLSKSVLLSFNTLFLSECIFCCCD